MKFSQYSEEAQKTADYPHIGCNLIYPVLGLCGESGEVAEKIKKLHRDHDGILTSQYRKEIIKELGDVLWYLNQIAFELGTSLQTIALANLEKLADRANRNKIHGNGDNR